MDEQWLTPADGWPHSQHVAFGNWQHRFGRPLILECDSGQVVLDDLVEDVLAVRYDREQPWILVTFLMRVVVEHISPIAEEPI